MKQPNATLKHPVGRLRADLHASQARRDRAEDASSIDHEGFDLRASSAPSRRTRSRQARGGSTISQNAKTSRTKARMSVAAKLVRKGRGGHTLMLETVMDKRASSRSI